MDGDAANVFLMLLAAGGRHFVFVCFLFLRRQIGNVFFEFFLHAVDDDHRAHAANANAYIKVLNRFIA